MLKALGEVANALNGQQKLVQVRVQREIAVRELSSSVDLSLDRYLLGLSDYFEVLTVEEQLYATQLALVQTQYDQLTNIVQLYRALGGGWQVADGATPPTGGPAPIKPVSGQRDAQPVLAEGK